MISSCVLLFWDEEAERPVFLPNCKDLLISNGEIHGALILRQQNDHFLQGLKVYKQQGLTAFYHGKRVNAILLDGKAEKKGLLFRREADWDVFGQLQHHVNGVQQPVVRHPVFQGCKVCSINYSAGLGKLKSSIHLEW